MRSSRQIQLQVVRGAVDSLLRLFLQFACVLTVDSGPAAAMLSMLSAAAQSLNDIISRLFLYFTLFSFYIHPFIGTQAVSISPLCSSKAVFTRVNNSKTFTSYNFTRSASASFILYTVHFNHHKVANKVSFH